MEKFVLSARTGKCGTVLDVGAVALWLLNADWWVEFVRVAQLEVSDNQVQMEIIHVRSAPLELDTSPWETARYWDVLLQFDAEASQIYARLVCRVFSLASLDRLLVRSVRKALLHMAASLSA
eukprot:gb/GEZJ01001718.1/.p2 GENE.gb/GEZJ01001718.1/~~gb/GEZJ01001718.1/.p2  ORF type:complete len:122 (-),score=4.06 gb/GEZJ01001718.1/:411-776(-)